MFFGREVTWTQGPYEAEGLQTLTIAITVPVEAYMEAAQRDYLSTVIVMVQVEDITRDIKSDRTSAPWARAVWDDRGAMSLFDPAQADTIAAGGAYSAVAREATLLVDDEGHLEFGPPAAVRDGGAP